jgi:hypothetical protein
VSGKPSKSKTLFKYDPEGNLIKEIRYPSNGNAPYTIVSYEYNKVGNLVEKTEYGSSNSINKITTYDCTSSKQFAEV